MSTVQCKKCGKRISLKEKECPHCGEPVPHSTATDAPHKPSKLKRTEERYKQIRGEQPKQDENLTDCKACGEKISKNASTCPHCGEPVPKKKKTSMWTWLLILMIIGYVAGNKDRGETSTSTSSSYSKTSKPKKERKKTLKGGYFACTSEALFDEIITAAVNKDDLAVGHLLSRGCVLTKKGVRFSIIDLGIGTTKIRAYNGADSVILYTNTENVYY